MGERDLDGSHLHNEGRCVVSIQVQNRIEGLPTETNSNRDSCHNAPNRQIEDVMANKDELVQLQRFLGDLQFIATGVYKREARRAKGQFQIINKMNDKIDALIAERKEVGENES